MLVLVAWSLLGVSTVIVINIAKMLVAADSQPPLAGGPSGSDMRTTGASDGGVPVEARDGIVPPSHPGGIVPWRSSARRRSV